MASLAYAQAGQGAAPGPFIQLLPLFLILVVFYFLLIRPQQQRAKAQRAMIDNLRRNDEVMTAGGLYGRIIELGEKVITLEIAPNVRVKSDRSRIEMVIGGGKAGKGGGSEKGNGKEK